MDSIELTTKAHHWAGTLNDEALSFLSRRGISPALGLRAGLGYVDEPGKRFHGAISIPYWNPDKECVGIRFRYLEPEGNKYDSIRGVKAHLYNVVDSAKSKVWLAEGEFDTLILSRLGLPACGIPGAQSFKPAWRFLFASTDQVTICMDQDEAGQRGAQRLASILSGIVPTVRLVRLPEGNDITDLYLRDTNALRQLLD